MIQGGIEMGNMRVMSGREGNRKRGGAREREGERGREREKEVGSEGEMDREIGKYIQIYTSPHPAIRPPILA